MISKNTRIHAAYILIIIFLLSITYVNTVAENQSKRIKEDDKKIIVARYSNKKITLYELNIVYYAQHKHLLNINEDEIDKYANDPGAVIRLPALKKRVFLEELIKQKLVYFQAEQEGFLKNEQLLALINIAREGAVVQTYIKEKFKKNIKVSDVEIEKEYMKERDNKYQGLPIDQAEKHIEQRLKLKKLQEKTTQLIERLKTNAKIIINEKAFGKKKTVLDKNK